MLHARHHFLADIAALPEADAADLVEQHVMREGIAQRIVGPAFGDAVRDAERMPVGFVRVGRGLPGVVAQHRPVDEAAVAKRVESVCEPVESVCEAPESRPHETATSA